MSKQDGPSVSPFPSAVPKAPPRHWPSPRPPAAHSPVTGQFAGAPQEEQPWWRKQGAGEEVLTKARPTRGAWSRPGLPPHPHQPGC